MVSLHGRPLEAIVPHLQPGARILALSWDGTTPAKLAALLAARGMGRSRLTVCEAMGGPRERVRTDEAEGFALDDVAALNTIALEVARRPRCAHRCRARRDCRTTGSSMTARSPSATSGRSRSPRSRRGAANSCGTSAPARVRSRSNGCSRTPPIARSRSSPAPTARPASRATRLRSARRRSPSSTGKPRTLSPDLPEPDAIFVGGGGTAPGLIDRVVDALRPGGRLVVNAVTLETQAAAVEWRASWGGELAQIAIAHAEPIGRFSGWRAAMPVVQWRWTKP